MKILNFISICLCIIIGTNTTNIVNAQTINDGKIHFSGSIFDKSTNKPIAFANIGIKGTTSGAASDFDGKFILQFTEKDYSFNLQISAVGYKSFSGNLEEVYDKYDKKTIYLEPVNYNINQVEIKADSKVLQKLIKDAIDGISKNYEQGEFNYKLYVSENAVKNNNKIKTEYIILTDHKKGYKRSNGIDNFKNIKYKVLESKRSFEPNSLYEEINPMDDILSMDVIMDDKGILNKDYVRQYKLKRLNKKTDKIAEISYECKHPHISNSGDAYAIKYWGIIYIDNKTKAVIRNISNYQTSANSKHGRIFKLPKDPKEIIEYSFDTKYKINKNNKYILDKIEFSKTFNKDRSNQSQTNTFVKIIEFSNKNTITIDTREYHENRKANEKFWNKFELIR
ncbi:MAG: carboxypeptidase-like regulatory domain-containing protein [Marinifilaceae bacterium]|jgi:hypothetical protein|nr:carboxypeptidase-like regulatory domain-containing protein [Marinifilaceae bacterium]